MKYTLPFIRFRRLGCALLALLTFGALLLHPGMVLKAHSADKTVAIPSPADYFGDVDDTDSGKNNTAYYFEGYRTFPGTKVEKYVKALKKAGLTTTDKSDSSIIDLKYNGDKKVQISWDKSNQWIRVNVVKPLSVSASTTNTKDDTADTLIKNADGQIIIPDPQEYFGTFDRTIKGGSRTVYHCNGYSSYPSSKMESFVKALKEVGLTGGEIVRQDNGDMLAQFYLDDSNSISIRWYKKDQYVWFNVSNELSFTTDSSSGDPSILDIIEDIFGKYDKMEEHFDDDSFYTLYSFYVSSYPTGKVNNFVNKLKDLGLQEVMKYDRSDGRKCYEYQWENEVLIKIWNYPQKKKDDTFMIGVFWDILKNSGIFDSTDVPSDPVPVPPPNGTVECGTCRGRRYCQECGGKGEEKKPLIGQPGVYTTKTCGTCHGLKICPTCEGYGWVRG